MILYLDRSRSAMIYILDRSCLGHRFRIDRIISTLIHTLFIILHIYYVLTEIVHVLDIYSLNRQYGCLDRDEFAEEYTHFVYSKSFNTTMKGTRCKKSKLMYYSCRTVSLIIFSFSIFGWYLEGHQGYSSSNFKTATD